MVTDLLICSTLHSSVTVSKIGTPFAHSSWAIGALGLLTVPVYIMLFWRDCFGLLIFIDVHMCLVLKIKQLHCGFNRPIGKNTFWNGDVIHNIVRTSGLCGTSILGLHKRRQTGSHFFSGLVYRQRCWEAPSRNSWWLRPSSMIYQR
jgi:hypothetical protein